MNVCCEVFAVFENILGSNLWLQINDDDNVLIDVFHSRHELEALVRIPSVFS